MRNTTSFRRALSVVSISAALALALSLFNPSVPPAQGDAPILAVVDVEIVSSFTDVNGTRVTEDRPEFIFTATDPTNPESVYPDYQAGIELRELGSSTVIEFATVDAERNEHVSVATWRPPVALENGVAFEIRARVTTPQDVGSWTAWIEFSTVFPGAAPTLVRPENNATVPLSQILEVQIPEYSSELGNVGNLVIESGWATGAPVIVFEGQLEPDEGGAFELRLDEIPGFTPGQYRWRSSYSSPYSSEWSEYSYFLAGAVPDAVIGAYAYQYERVAYINWDTPNASDLEVLDYLVSVEPGGIELVTTQPFVEVSNLDFLTHTVTIVARNVLGSGAPTSFDFDMVKYAPHPPVDLEAQVDLTDVVLSWSPPADDGGSSVENYEVTIVNRCTWDVVAQVSTVSTSFSMSDLELGCLYDGHVTATTGEGESSAAYVQFNPFGLPDAPTNMGVQPGDTWIDVFWDAPEFHNGDAVTAYEVTVVPSNRTIVVDASSTVRQGLKVEGLTNGVGYSFKVVARNRAGLSVEELSEESIASDQAVDSDSDGLPDLVEARIGSDPHLTDTDGDAIGDSDELFLLVGLTSIVLADSDSDGVLDPDEDSDGDTITNGVELATGTNPGSPDSDVDGVDDHEELLLESDPLSVDGDDDGLEDNDELQLGLDPSSADTDGDGTPDGADELDVVRTDAHWDSSELAAVSADRPELAISQISANLRGAAAHIVAWSVEAYSSADLSGAVTSAGAVVAPDNTNDIDVELDELVFGYSAAIVESRLDDLAPVVWDEVANTWKIVDNDVSVSTADKTISIVSPTTGLRYAVVDLGAWASNLQECAGAAPLDVEIVMDETWSVQSYDEGRDRFDAVRAVLSSLRPGDRVLLRAFTVEGQWGRGTGGETANSYIYRDLIDRIEEVPEVLLQGATSSEAALLKLATIEDYIIEEPSANDTGDGPYSAETLFGVKSAMPELSPEIVNPYVEGGPNLQCRNRAIVLVTDGEMIPAASQEAYDGADWSFYRTFMNPVEGYVPLAARSIPVHVLDVGSEDIYGSIELAALASETDGTYSYIPTSGDLDAWIDEVAPIVVTTEDTVIDTDGDGISDWIEKRGFTSTMIRPGAGNVRFFSSPYLADTDGDGLSDPQEYGDRFISGTRDVDWNSTRPVSAYYMVSNPSFPDGDWDGLSDLEEIEFRMDPLSPDMDSDGVLDGMELLNGTFPYMQNSDKDSYLDIYEIVHRSEGYDPIVFNPRLTGVEWVGEALLGWSCGDFDVCGRPTVPWLIGNLVSGLMIFGDIRDAVANYTEGRYVNAALCVVGLIPVIGDTASVLAKSSKFLRGVVGPTGLGAKTTKSSVLRFISQYVKPAVFNELVENPDLFGGNVEINAMFAGMRASGASETTIRNAILSNGLDALVELYDFPRIVAMSHTITPTKASHQEQADGYLLSELHIPTYRRTPHSIQMPPVLTRPSQWVTRYWDARTTSGGLTYAHEFRVGLVRGTYSEYQLATDIRSIVDGDVDRVRYHFMMDADSGLIGASKAILDSARSNPKVSISIHLPGSN